MEICFNRADQADSNQEIVNHREKLFCAHEHTLLKTKESLGNQELGIDGMSSETNDLSSVVLSVFGNGKYTSP